MLKQTRKMTPMQTYGCTCVYLASKPRRKNSMRSPRAVTLSCDVTACPLTVCFNNISTPCIAPQSRACNCNWYWPPPNNIVSVDVVIRTVLPQHRLCFRHLIPIGSSGSDTWNVFETPFANAMPRMQSAAMRSTHLGISMQKHRIRKQRRNPVASRTPLSTVPFGLCRRICFRVGFTNTSVRQTNAGVRPVFQGMVKDGRVDAGHMSVGRSGFNKTLTQLLLHFIIHWQRVSGTE